MTAFLVNLSSADAYGGLRWRASEIALSREKFWNMIAKALDETGGNFIPTSFGNPGVEC